MASFGSTNSTSYMALILRTFNNVSLFGRWCPTPILRLKTHDSILWKISNYGNYIVFSGLVATRRRVGHLRSSNFGGQASTTPNHLRRLGPPSRRRGPVAATATTRGVGGGGASSASESPLVSP
jgi:hypothetical protein